MSSESRPRTAPLLAVLLLGAAGVQAQTAVTIGGAVYSGRASVTWTLSPLGEPIPHRIPILPAVPLTFEANNARVMIQDMHTGDVVTYGTFAAGTNGWTASVPDGGTYIAMFSATGHNLTSRVYDLSLGSVFPAVITDAYLPALHQDLATGTVAAGNAVQPAGNLLVYAFDEREVNGAPDWPIDHSLPGVFVELYEPRTGNVVASGFTIGGTGAPTSGGADDGFGGTQTITTSDGLVFFPVEARGHVYLTNIPPGEYRLRATPPNVMDGQNNPWSGGWYHTYTMEGTQEWEILTFPGDPGTEAGGAIAWFGFAKKLGQLPAGVAGAGSSISGVIEDADVAWELPIPGEPPEAGAPLDPIFINQGVSTNGALADAFLVLWQRTGDTFRILATTETDANGAFSIDNIPAGMYNIFFVDKKLENIFGEMQITVDGINDVVLPLFANEVPGMPLAIIPRFAARVRGHVMDDAGYGINGAVVNLRYQAGNAVFSETTAFDPQHGDGWYNFDFLPEIETMAMIDVEPPPGYRGALVTDTYYPNAFVPPDPACVGFPNCPIVPVPCNPAIDPGCVITGTPVDVLRNGMNRWVQYYTANYQSNLILEPIPTAVGHVSGIVYNDSLAMGTWVGDGLYDKVDEGIVGDVTVELVNDLGDVVAVTTSGAYDPNVAVAQGYIRPGISVPPDEWGGFFSGPMPGHFEFRDVTPGAYTVRLTLPNGFHAPGEIQLWCITTPCPLIVEYPVFVTSGARTDLDIGIHTLVPLAGQLEGGIFDDTNLDLRWYSAFSEEKQLLVGLGVIVRDYLGYTLDTLVQPSGVCYPGTTVIGSGGPANMPYGAICDRPDLGNSVEIDRLVAPGLHLYWGNDPLLPICSGADGGSLFGDPPCRNPNLFDLELPYTMGQGLTKYEADWSLPPTLPGGGGGGGAAICVAGMTASSSFTENPKWTASVTVTVEDVLGPLPGAEVIASWSNGQASAAITNGNGQATLVLETVENQSLTEVTATLTVTPGEGGGGTFDAACGVGDCITIFRPDIGGSITCGIIVAPVCGDGNLDPGEDSCNCPADAGPPGDADGDGVNDCLDICPGFNDLADADGDGVPDGCDNCPAAANADQADADGNGIGDVCDAPPPPPDADGDGIPDALDNCPNTANADQADADGDGVGDVCDNCPAVANADQADADGNGIGDACDTAPPPAAGVIVESLIGSAQTVEGAKWKANVTVTVTNGGAPAANVEVVYSFGGETKAKKTNGAGQFTTKAEIEGAASVTFTITDVSDPDYDAAGSVTSVTISRPQ